ncbi:MAG: PAS domain-containing protein [Proteobacteria bacterium]|nr:PAS domain-containing protein [Pseudomonadota bacterium]
MAKTLTMIRGAASAVPPQNRWRSLEIAALRWRRVVDLAPCAILMIDGDGRIDWANQSALHLFECAPVVLAGTSLFDYVACGLLADLLDRRVSSAGRVICPATVRSARGRTAAVELIVEAALDEQGASYLVTIDDSSDRTRLQREVLDSAERERRRIGRDLHDCLGQQLVGVGLLVRNLIGRLREQAVDEALVQLADRAAEIVGEMVGQTRDLARGLYPVELETKGLVQALQALVTQTADLGGIRVELRVQLSRLIDIDMERASHLYRIAQEALSNAVRHAKAQSILVWLHSDADRIELSVIDDGRGLAPFIERGDGLGFRLMAERASIIGALLTIESEGEGGTRVRCTLSAG